MGCRFWSASGMGGNSGKVRLAESSRHLLHILVFVFLDMTMCFAGVKVRHCAQTLDRPNLPQLRVKAM